MFMENNHVTICPQCGENIDHASSVFLAPNLLEEFEWICKNCGFKKKKVVHKDDVRSGESLKAEKE